MRSTALLLAVIASLVLATTVAARPQTTNPGEYHTVRVIVTDKGVTMSTTRVARGSTAIFLLTNNSKRSHVFAVGDASLTHRRGTGFAVKLERNERRRVQLYLTYRGPLPLTLSGSGKPKVAGVLYVT